MSQKGAASPVGGVRRAARDVPAHGFAMPPARYIFPSPRRCSVRIHIPTAPAPATRRAQRRFPRRRHFDAVSSVTTSSAFHSGTEHEASRQQVVRQCRCCAQASRCIRPCTRRKGRGGPGRITAAAAPWRNAREYQWRQARKAVGRRSRPREYAQPERQAARHGRTVRTLSQTAYPEPAAAEPPRRTNQPASGSSQRQAVLRTGRNACLNQTRRRTNKQYADAYAQRCPARHRFEGPAISR